MDYEVGDHSTADRSFVWLLAAGQGPWAYPAAYRLYARFVCDINSALELDSGDAL